MAGLFYICAIIGGISLCISCARWLATRPWRRRGKESAEAVASSAAPVHTATEGEMLREVLQRLDAQQKLLDSLTAAHQANAHPASATAVNGTGPATIELRAGRPVNFDRRSGPLLASEQPAVKAKLMSYRDAFRAENGRTPHEPADWGYLWPLYERYGDLRRALEHRPPRVSKTSPATRPELNGGGAALPLALPFAAGAALDAAANNGNNAARSAARDWLDREPLSSDEDLEQPKRQINHLKRLHKQSSLPDFYIDSRGSNEDSVSEEGLRM